MRLLKNSILTVNRYGEQLLTETGDVVVGPATTYQVKCNYQPVPNVQKGEVAANLPSGIQISDVLVLYTTAELRMDSELNKTTADEIIIGSSLYKVHQERDWSAQTSQIKHREYLIIKKVKR